MNVQRTRRGSAWVICSLCAIGLTACGGGGSGSTNGGSLTINFDYATNMAYLYRPTTVAAELNGIDGHTPNCTIVGGALPPGMSLDAGTCNLAGTPTEAGNYTATVQLSVAGYAGTVQSQPQVTVYGPPVTYPKLSGASIALTEPVSFSATNINSSVIPDWKAQAGESVAYSLQSGSLPPGLSLDAATGALSGSVGATGSYSFTVAATVTRGAQVETQASEMLSILVDQPPVIVQYVSQGATTAGSAVLMAPVITDNIAGGGSGIDLSGATYLYSLVAGSAMPAGVSLDPATGIISGQPVSKIRGGYIVNIDVLVTHNGQSFTVHTSAAVQVY